jgi:hypothetical protein
MEKRYGQAEALAAQERMRPYIEKAERDAQRMYEIMTAGIGEGIVIEEIRTEHKSFIDRLFDPVVRIVEKYLL